VQTGFGRTGRWFASEHFQLDPDLVCVAKSLAGGLPLSAVVGKAGIMDAAPDSSIGGTYVGNPVACAAALAVLDEMEQQDLPAQANRIGAWLRERLERLAERYPIIGDVRGLGAMLAIELVKDRASKEPAPEATTELIQRAMQRGLLLLRAGIYGNVIRILVPLVLTEEQAEEACEVLEACLAELG
ncbi:MAG TPA: aminotransferase class III-fold pyridoxal phosphate-dependent enzyme, partial [Bacillota bacterium]